MNEIVPPFHASVLDQSVVSFSTTGCSFAVGLAYEQWQAIGTQLRRIEKAALWWIGDWLNYGERSYGEMYAQALEETDYSYQSLNDAKWVANKFDFSCRHENLSWTHHREAAALDIDDARALLDEAEREGLTVREVRRRAASLKNDALRAARADPPAGKYRCIVIDPPWPMERIDRETVPQPIELDYPVMSHDDIAGLCVSDWAADDGCHLFCWTTQKNLRESLSIVEGWGFSYCVLMVWHKPGGFQPFGLPQYNCEFVVYARKNSPAFEDTTQFFTCFAAPRREHSRKPDEFYDLVRRVTPGPRIDIFSRETRSGFEQYGNEPQRFAA